MCVIKAFKKILKIYKKKSKPYMSLSNQNSVLTLKIELQCICITFFIHYQNLSSCKFQHPHNMGVNSHYRGILGDNYIPKTPYK